MCGRYSNKAEFSEIRLEFNIDRVDLFREYHSSYNISPTYGPGYEQLIVVRGADGKREARLARWWMVPEFWKKPLKDLPTAFNARAEEVASKPFWKDAFRLRRCLVPATGWREFKPEGKAKQPYHFHLQQHLFAFAGLWSSWVSPDGECIDSFAIITTEANSIAAPIHSRMPLILPTASHSAWLDPKTDAGQLLAQACTQARSAHFDVHPSNPIANKSAFEGPEAIEQVEPLRSPQPGRSRLPGL
ncbi:MAG TPA: SOS response-associated peptidase [Polyangiaceae bacterium]|jgi:putative SOS response-associated peptidase YedK|nr:SOS response-associated peptidase [Polyangiaceae bacterium]